MATLCDGGRITTEVVRNEIDTLRNRWGLELDEAESDAILERYLGGEVVRTLDYIERVQLEAVIRVCMGCQSAAEAGRKLYDVSRLQKSSSNDSHRLGVYLKKYGLSFEAVRRLGVSVST